MWQCYSVIIDRGISATGHGKQVVDVLNTIDKRYIYELMSNVQIPGSKMFDQKIIMYSCTKNIDVSLAKGFQKYLSKDNRKHGVIDHGKYRIRASKKIGRQRIYCSG